MAQGEAYACRAHFSIGRRVHPGQPKIKRSREKAQYSIAPIRAMAERHANQPSKGAQRGCTLSQAA
jgi:hypothetical protein